MIVPPRRMAPGEHLTAANYNALLDYVRRITPRQGANVAVDYRLDGAVISGMPGGKTDRSAKPFTVRLHKTEDDPDGQWEIYLPPGCCNVGCTCDPINPKANATSGHEDDGGDWYAIHFDQSLEFATTDNSSNTGQGVMEYTNSFVVSAHAKTSAKRYGVDLAGAPARSLLWIGVRDMKRSTGDWGGRYPDSVRYKDTPGDTWSCVVAEIFGSMEIDWSQPGASAANAEKHWRLAQYRTTPIDVAPPQGTGVSNFDLVWNLAVGSDGELEVKNLFCVRQLAAVAGIAVTGDQMTDVEGAEWVYAKIHADDMSNGADIVEVVADPGNDVYSGDTNIVWLPLYQLKHNTVSADHREASLKNVQLYRA